MCNLKVGDFTFKFGRIEIDVRIVAVLISVLFCLYRKSVLR